MQVAMIAAMANNRVIGADNKMPWHLPADLRHFKRTTMGKPVIMGRKTYESIGKALPGRLNIVITTQTQYSLPDAEVVHSAQEALKRASQLFQQYHGDDCEQDELHEVMVIGGGEIYRTFLPIAETLYLTLIDLDVEGDTTFPDYQALAHWRMVERQPVTAGQDTDFTYTFTKFIKT